MPIDLIKRAYWWLPFKPDGTPYQGSPSGGWNWITEPGYLGLGPRYSELRLPTWLPRQIFVVHAFQGYGCSSGGIGCELAAYIDPGGKSYGSSHPPGQEGNLDRCITLINTFDYNLPYEKLEDSGEFSAPVLWDRDAGDRLVAMYANGPPLDWVYLEIQFLVPNIIPPTDVGPGY